MGSCICRYSKYVAAGSNDGNIFIWNLNSKLETILGGHTNPFASSLFSIDWTKYCTIWCDVIKYFPD